MSYNRWIGMGRLTSDPELRQTTSGVPMCRITVAVDRPAKKGEERQADFINVVCWRQTAEFVSRYFSKGRMIHVEGRLQTNNYTDQNGQKRYSMDVVADNVTFCGDKQAQRGGGYQNNQDIVYASTGTQGTGDFEEFEEILSDGEPPF